MYIKSLYEYFRTCDYNVTTDSRNCPKGALFFALKGDNFDGNKYAASALENGAAYAVVDNPEVITTHTDRYILVHDTLLALQLMANYHRQLLDIPIIAITGTNGKTTTKELIAAVLEKTYKVHYTKGNFNNHIGVPLTLLGLRAWHEIGVIEMGANHPGEIKDLARIVQPTCGLITNVGKAHLEGFGSFEGVVNTKAELYDYLRLSRESTVFLNNDDKLLKDKAEGINYRLTYGTTEDADVCGKIGSDSITLTVEWKESKRPENEYSLSTQLVGDYNLYNILSAISIGLYYKVPVEEINQALSDYKPSNNRSQLKSTAKNQLIIDAYNANPTSMHAALKNFSQIKAKNKLAILGDMRELGQDSAAEHQNILNYLSTTPDINQVYLVGKEFGKLDSKYSSFEDVSKLIEDLKANPIQDHTVLIKGSNGINLSKIVDFL